MLLYFVERLVCTHFSSLLIWLDFIESPKPVSALEPTRSSTVVVLNAEYGVSLVTVPTALGEDVILGGQNDYAMVPTDARMAGESSSISVYPDINSCKV